MIIAAYDRGADGDHDMSFDRLGNLYRYVHERVIASSVG